QLYYVRDFTQEQIARRIGVSRSNVSRMLKEARSQGMVEIRIHSPLRTVSGLQEELASRLGLRECLVLAALDRDSRAFEATDTVNQVAALGARHLRENIAEGDIIGLGWGRSVHRVVHNRFLREERDVTVAQVMGSIGGSIAEYDGVATTARLASALGASAHYLHAPALVTDAAVRSGLLRDPHIRKTLEVARRSDIMVASVGTIGREHGQYRTGYLSDADLDYIRGKGVAGEVCSIYFALDGSLVPLEMNERSIAIGSEELKRIPTRVGVASGPEKPAANIGAARSGLLNVLITDEDTAAKMLDILDNEAESAGN
ncbi:MAG: sugar-binding transcriptional regulator, partial [Rubrobacteraceae bacterium]